MYSINSINAKWPSSNSLGIKLLGIFDNELNQSSPMFRAAVILSQQYNMTVNGYHIGWQEIQSKENLLDVVSSTCEVITSAHIAGMVGPALSRHSSLMANFAERIRIPVISYGATSSRLSDRQMYPTFYRTIPSDQSAAVAIASLFLRYDWTSCIMIHQNDAFGIDGERVIREEFLKKNLTIVNTFMFDSVTNTIRENLQTLLVDSASRIVVLWADSYHTSLILQTALDANVLGPHFTWISNSRFSSESFNQNFFSSQLIGMFTIEPTTAIAINESINTTLLTEAYAIWKQYEPDTLPLFNDISSYALFTFDATWFLLQALSNFCSRYQNHSSNCLIFLNSPLCFKHQLLNSNDFMATMNNMKVLGVSGNLQFNNHSTDRVTDAYYLLYNYQFISNSMRFIPVLTHTQKIGWQPVTKVNPIIWPGSSLIPSIDRPQLDGVTLKIGIGGIEPFLIVNTFQNSSSRNITKMTGYVPELVELLRIRLGFIPDIRLVPSDVTNSVLIKAVVNGTYDIIITDMTVTASRRKIVDFSNSIFDTSTFVIMRDSRDLNIDLLSFLKPFSRNLWLLILGMVFYAGIVFCAVENQYNEHLRTESLISRLAMSFWYCFATLVGYGADFHVHTAPGRVLTVGLYISSIVLVASYTANLASDLVVLKSKNIITGIDDIKSGKMPFNRIGIIPHTSIEDYYLREVSNGVRNYYPLDSPEALLDALTKGTIDACLLDSGFSEYLINNIYCGLTLVGQSFDVGIFGIVTPKGWLYSQDMDVNILSLRETGDIDRLKTKWFNRKICPEQMMVSTALEVESMRGLFLTFGIISILSLILFLFKKYSLFTKLHVRWSLHQSP